MPKQAVEAMLTLLEGSYLIQMPARIFAKNVARPAWGDTP